MFSKLIDTVRKSTSGASTATSINVDALSATETFAAGDVAFHTIGSNPFGAAPHSTSAHEAGVDVWVLPRTSMARYALLLPQLSDDEHRHAAGLKRDEDRVRYIAVRAMLRVALSHRVNNEIESGHWTLTVNAQGKPEIDPGQARCSFSITHAEAFSVIAIAADATIGIDAEKVDAGALEHLPTTCLTAREQKRLNKKTGDDRCNAFFRLWTLKEAYTKALGLGFSADFDRIEFDADRVALTRKAPTAPDAKGDFDIVTLQFDGATYLLALCVLGGSAPARTVRVVA